MILFVHHYVHCLFAENTHRHVFCRVAAAILFDTSSIYISTYIYGWHFLLYLVEHLHCTLFSSTISTISRLYILFCVVSMSINGAPQLPRYLHVEMVTSAIPDVQICFSRLTGQKDSNHFIDLIWCHRWRVYLLLLYCARCSSKLTNIAELFNPNWTTTSTLLNSQPAPSQAKRQWKKGDKFDAIC